MGRTAGPAQFLYINNPHDILGSGKQEPLNEWRKSMKKPRWNLSKDDCQRLCYAVASRVGCGVINEEGFADISACSGDPARLDKIASSLESKKYIVRLSRVGFRLTKKAISAFKLNPQFPTAVVNEGVSEPEVREILCLYREYRSKTLRMDELDQQITALREEQSELTQEMKGERMSAVATLLALTPPNQ